MKKKYKIYLIISAFIIGILVSYISFLTVGSDNNKVQKVQSKNIKVDLNTLKANAKDEYYNGYLSKSEKIYEQILKRNPTDLETIKNIIFIKKELGQLENIQEYYYKLINLDPDNILWKYEFGITLYQKGNYKDAKTILDQIYDKIEKDQGIISNKRRSILCYYLGEINLKKDDNEQALAYFEQGIKTDSSIILNFLGKAEAYTGQNKLLEANNSYKKVLNKDYSMSILYNKIAQNYEVLDKPKLAYYYWKRSLATGNLIEESKEHIKKLEEQYPELKKDEKKDQEQTRVKVDWIKVKPLEEIEGIPRLKVGLLEHVSQVTFQAASSFNVFLKDKNKPILNGEANTEWRVEYSNSFFSFFEKDEFVKKVKSDSILKIEFTRKDAAFVLYNVSYGSGYFWAGNEDRQYRGTLELYPVKNKNYINVLNQINMEEYLISVVPGEMPAWWPEEALKAQSIAARSYAMKNLGKHSNEGYDLCATVHCAVYKGVTAENKKSTQAVLATKGEVATYNGKVINAVFSSNSGGYSENSQDVWGNQVSYLDGADNMIDNSLNFPLEPYNLMNWIKEEPPSYSNISPYTGANSYRWVKVVPADQLVRKYHLEKLNDIIPVMRSNGGSVEEIILKGASSKEVKIKRDKIRSGLGGLRSNRFVIQKIYDENHNIDKLIIYGSGWGHNVGLDQTATAGMAAKDFKYDEIIKHFYKGVDLKKIY